MSKEDAVSACQFLRPVIDPIGSLSQCLDVLEKDLLNYFLKPEDGNGGEHSSLVDFDDCFSFGSSLSPKQDEYDLKKGTKTLLLDSQSHSQMLNQTENQNQTIKSRVSTLWNESSTESPVLLKPEPVRTRTGTSSLWFAWLFRSNKHQHRVVPLNKDTEQVNLKYLTQNVDKDKVEVAVYTSAVHSSDPTTSAQSNTGSRLISGVGQITNVSQVPQVMQSIRHNHSDKDVAINNDKDVAINNDHDVAINNDHDVL